MVSESLVVSNRLENTRYLTTTCWSLRVFNIVCVVHAGYKNALMEEYFSTLGEETLSNNFKNFEFIADKEEFEKRFSELHGHESKERQKLMRIGSDLYGSLVCHQPIFETRNFEKLQKYLEGSGILVDLPKEVTEDLLPDNWVCLEKILMFQTSSLSWKN